MDRASALRRLPTAYSRALEWQDEGITDEDIATRLEIPIEALPSTIRIAEHKLAQLMRDPEAEHGRPEDGDASPSGTSEDLKDPIAELTPVDHDTMIDVVVRHVICRDISRALRADRLRQLAVLLGATARVDHGDAPLSRVPWIEGLPSAI